MNDIDFGDYFIKLRPQELIYLDKKFDFDINIDHFIEWLKSEKNIISGNYSLDCTAMCEYSCLYVAMLFHDVKLKGELTIYYGSFGPYRFEHYWMGYLIDGEQYFIDLTLQQFIESAPKLAITKAEQGMYSYASDGECIEEYVNRNRAFMFYTNPKTMEKPPIDIDKLEFNYGTT